MDFVRNFGFQFDPGCRLLGPHWSAEKFGIRDSQSYDRAATTRIENLAIVPEIIIPSVHALHSKKSAV